MKIVISQPRYLPALNYLQRLYNADLFIFLDDVQRQGRGFENRNKVLLNGKEKMLTIPILSSSRDVIYNTLVKGSDWKIEHLNLLKTAYSKHKFFDLDFLNDLYCGNDEDLFFSNITITHLIKISNYLGFEFSYIKASELNIDHSCKGPRHLYDIAREVKATTYISGENGRDYGVADAFSNDISVLYHFFSHPIYTQVKSNNFIPWLSFFDALFTMGRKYVLSIVSNPLQLKK